MFRRWTLYWLRREEEVLLQGNTSTFRKQQMIAIFYMARYMAPSTPFAIVLMLTDGDIGEGLIAGVMALLFLFFVASFVALFIKAVPIGSMMWYPNGFEGPRGRKHLAKVQGRIATLERPLGQEKREIE